MQEFKIGNRGTPIKLCVRCNIVRGLTQKKLLSSIKKETLGLTAEGLAKCLRCHKVKTLDQFKTARNTITNRCLSCRKYMADKAREARSQWDEARRSRAANAHRETRLSLRREVLGHYGLFCACCGETMFECLAIDHIDNNGADHRKQLRQQYQAGEVKAAEFYNWLKAHHFPPGFQTLCFNCNWMKHTCGVCPHQRNVFELARGA